MRLRLFGSTLLALLAGGIGAATTQAQIYYPYGYNNYGWGGWGVGSEN
jgi:hypothetical protein